MGGGFYTEIMNVGDKVGYWLDIAAYDLETARAMLKSGRLSQLVDQTEAEDLVKQAEEAFAWLHSRLR